MAPGLPPCRREDTLINSRNLMPEIPIQKRETTATPGTNIQLFVTLNRQKPHIFKLQSPAVGLSCPGHKHIFRNILWCTCIPTGRETNSQTEIQTDTKRDKPTDKRMFQAHARRYYITYIMHQRTESHKFHFVKKGVSTTPNIKTTVPAAVAAAGAANCRKVLEGKSQCNGLCLSSRINPRPSSTEHSSDLFPVC